MANLSLNYVSSDDLAKAVASLASAISDLTARVAELEAPLTPPPVVTDPPPVVTPPPATVDPPPVVIPPVSTGWPDASNTGPTGALRVVSGNHTVAAGATETGLDIQGSCTLGKNAKLVNSKVRGIGEDSWIVSMGSGSTLDHVEIGGGANGTTFNKATGLWTGGPGNLITGCNIHHTSDGLRVDGGTTVKDTWVHDLVINQIAGVHGDGSQSTDSTNKNPIVFDHCSVAGGTNDALFFEHAGGSITVNNCLFTPDQTGGNQSSYGVAVYEGKGVTLTSNVFAKGWQASPILLNVAGTSSGNTWTDGSAVK